MKFRQRRESADLEPAGLRQNAESAGRRAIGPPELVGDEEEDDIADLNGLRRLVQAEGVPCEIRELSRAGRRAVARPELLVTVFALRQEVKACIQ